MLPPGVDEVAGVSAPGPTATTGTRRLLPGRRGPSPRSPEGFYGWHVAAASAAALVLTAPGQTAAVSAFVDPMIDELEISRTALSTAYLVGTLTGATAMPFVGRAVDRFGVRRVMAVVGVVFGAFLLSLSAATGLVGLTAGFVGIRMAGQGALGLVATTAVALWFTRRRGTVMGLVSAVGAAGISLSPVLLERLVSAHGWRAVWAGEGLLVWATVVPLALLVMRDRPSSLGQQVDGARRADDPPPTAEWGATRGEALRTPWFWVVTAAVCTSALLVTAVAFHQISLLGERGLSPTAAAANFLPQTAAALGSSVLAGRLVDRVRPELVLVGCMAALAAGLAWGVVVEPGWSALVFAVLVGSAGGSIRTVEASTLPRYLGTLHLGEIRGVLAALSVAATAFGPLLFAVVQDATGSYAPALLGSALVPLAVAALALVVRPPEEQPTATS